MKFPRSRSLALLVVAAGIATAGCTKIRDHQGYLVDDTLLASVQPGVDNRESVLGTLGRPSFTGQFDERDWYYVSRTTRQLAFARPSPMENTVFHVRFDEAGNVVSVDRAGMEQIASIEPMEGKTPTAGGDRGFFEEFFGNIGAVGAPGIQAGTRDNPQ